MASAALDRRQGLAGDDTDPAITRAAGRDRPYGTQRRARRDGYSRLWKPAALRRRGRLLGQTFRRASHQPRRAGLPDAKSFHEALVGANPDRLVWGGDWPHPRMEEEMPDVGHLLDLFMAWTPDAAIRRRILVTNPQRLYGFPAA